MSLARRGRNEFARLDPANIPAYDDAPASYASQGVEQELFERTLAAAHLVAVRGGTPSPATVAQADKDLPVAQVTALWSTRRFQAAAHERGIWPDETLTGQQVASLVAFADTSMLLTERQKLAALGIRYPTFKGWLSNPEYARAYADVNSHSLNEAAVRGDAKLAELVEAGNLKAIQYVNELTGKYRPGALDALNLAELLASLQSIITRRVKDPELLKAIAADIERLAEPESPGAIASQTYTVAVPTSDEEPAA